MTARVGGMISRRQENGRRFMRRTGLQEAATAAMAVAGLE